MLCPNSAAGRSISGAIAPAMRRASWWASVTKASAIRSARPGYWTVCTSTAGLISLAHGR